MANLSFDATQVAPEAAFEVLKSGWYAAQITGSELCATKDGLGHYVKLEYTIMGDANGERSNDRKVWTNLNIDNKNAKAVEIAQAHLSAICHSVGVLQIQQTEQLHAKPHMIRLKIRAASGNFDASNEISGFKPYEAAAAGGVAAPAAAPMMAPPAAPPAVQQPMAAPQAAPVAPVAPAPAPVAPVAAAPVAPAPAPVAPVAPVAPSDVPDWAAGGTPPVVTPQ